MSPKKKIRVNPWLNTMRNGCIFTFYLLILAFLLPGSLLSAADERKEGYFIILQIETTSDWTDVVFSNVGFDYVSDTLLYPIKEGDKGGGKVWLGILEVRKEAYDSTFTRVEFQLFFPKELPPAIEFFVRKGDIGYTRGSFFSHKRELLARFVNHEERWGDPTNRKDFSFASAVLRKAGLAVYRKPKRYQTEPWVLAFYYPWWGNNWLYQSKPAVTHQPQLGFYSSSDEKVIRKHIAMAEAAGIDGFIVSWWGKGTYTDQNLLKIARICEEAGFKFSIYLEEIKDTRDLREQLSYILSAYTKSAAFLKYHDQPVIFIYSRILDSIPLDSLRAAVSSSKWTAINYGYAPSNLSGFAGFHEYLVPAGDFPTIKQRYLLAVQIAHHRQKIACLPVMPGFDDRVLRKPGSFIDREKGEYYRRVWQAALESEPDWVLITSFNEWFEGTEIEPSKEYGDFYLRLTRHYSQLFKRGKR